MAPDNTNQTLTATPTTANGNANVHADVHGDVSVNANANVNPSTNPNPNPPPPRVQRPSTTFLRFLHDTNVPVNDSTQAARGCEQSRADNTKAYLDDWDKKWQAMKKD